MASSQVLASKDKKIAFRWLDELCVIATGPGACPDETWAEYIELHVQSAPVYIGESKNCCTLNYSPTTAPTTPQRRMITAAGERMRFDSLKHTAILSDSTFVRGSVTALSWLIPSMKIDMKSFKPEQFQKALDWLGGHHRFPMGEAVDTLRELAVFVGHSSLATPANAS